MQKSTLRLLSLQKVQARSIPAASWAEESSRWAQVLTEAQTLAKSPDLIQQRPTATNQAEKVEGKREGAAWLCHAAVISRCFFSLLIPFIQLPEDLLYESTRARNEPIAAGLVQKQPISRARKCLMGVSSGTLPVLLDFCPSRPESPSDFCCVCFYFLFLQKILTKKKLRPSWFCFYFSNFVALWYPWTKVFYSALHFCNSSYVQQHSRTLIYLILWKQIKYYNWNFSKTTEGLRTV